MLNSMNLEREDKISLKEMDEIISNICLLFVDVENIFIKDQIEESYAGRNMKGKKCFIKVVNRLMCLMTI